MTDYFFGGVAIGGCALLAWWVVLAGIRSARRAWYPGGMTYPGGMRCNHQVVPTYYTGDEVRPDVRCQLPIRHPGRHLVDVNDLTAAGYARPEF